MIKGSIQKEDITTVNLHAPNIGTSQYTGQMLTAIKGEINSNITRVRTLTPHLHQRIDHPERISIR